MNRLLLGCVASIVACGSVVAQAGGPLGRCNFAPLKYTGTGTVVLNYDQGLLGTRSKAQADAIVNAAIALWTNVPTSSVSITKGSDLPVDVTVANYTTYLPKTTVTTQYSDGINPVIYDTDGSIVDDLLGTGANNSVLGFAGSSASGSPCRYTEGEAVINGKIAITDATMTVVIAHEIGHLIGLDHTQLDSSQGLSAAQGSSNYPLMYPIAYRSFISLHEDEVAAVSALYPETNFNTVFGSISGNLMNGGNVVKGANIWAREVSTGKLYSTVSDYLTLGTGAYKLTVPAGNYTLSVEAIDKQFIGGSSVGPYSDDLSGFSFQAPLYSGSGATLTPMAALNFGKASPLQVQIVAGCTATLNFNLVGTDSVAGSNCVSPAVVSGPVSGTTLGGTSQTFSWGAISGATSYTLLVGTSPGQSNLGTFGGTTATSVLVTGLPNDGSIVYIRLVTNIGGTLYNSDSTYTAFSFTSHARSDLNGDGHSDLLYRNAATGVVYRILMSGLAVVQGAAAYSDPDTHWKVVGDGDFNGDGNSDLLYRNSVTGQLSIVLFSRAGLPTFATPFYTEPNAAWKIVATPDLDGDGKADILWHNQVTGQVFAMLMNGSSIRAQGTIYTEPNTTWKIAAVGDFAGTGKANQLLWRNTASGQVYLMTVASGPFGFTQTGAMIYTEPNTAWKILSAADFNGDGKSDILWRNDVTGQVYMMLMNNGTIASQGMVYTESILTWKIVAQGDYDGDGKADILYRDDATGQVYMMLMNGLAIASRGIVFTEPDSNWHLLGSLEYSL